MSVDVSEGLQESWLGFAASMSVCAPRHPTAELLLNSLELEIRRTQLSCSVVWVQHTLPQSVAVYYYRTEGKKLGSRASGLYDLAYQHVTTSSGGAPVLVPVHDFEPGIRIHRSGSEALTGTRIRRRGGKSFCESPQMRCAGSQSLLSEASLSGAFTASSLATIEHLQDCQHLVSQNWRVL